MSFDVVWENIALYLQGAQLTLELLIVSLLFGLLLAVPLAIVRSRGGWTSRVVWLYTYVFRGTPMLVQLFLVYYGLAQFEIVRESAAWPLFSSAWFCAALTFILNTTAYTTEIFAGGIHALPKGEIEAARAMGMSPLVMLRRIVLPGALRRSLPAYGNEMIFMLHGTSLASVVTLMDLTSAAREVNASNYIPFEAFLTAGAMYLVMTMILVGLFHKAEARWLQPILQS